MSSYTSTYPGTGFYGNAVDDAQIESILGKDYIKQVEITAPGVDAKTNLPESLIDNSNKAIGDSIYNGGKAAISFVEKLAERILGIFDGVAGAFNVIKSYWQYIAIAIVALVVLKND